jgi:hypothetical protein
MSNAFILSSNRNSKSLGMTVCSRPLDGVSIMLHNPPAIGLTKQSSRSDLESSFEFILNLLGVADCLYPGVPATLLYFLVTNMQALGEPLEKKQP